MTGTFSLSTITASSLPTGALLSSYHKNGTHTDCYTTEISSTVTQSQYILAFYTSTIFNIERSILKWTVAKPSTDLQAQQLADGVIDTFAAWSVEERSENQLLLADFSGRTKSWLMTVPLTAGEDHRTRLYFGSAVVPVLNARTGKSSLGFGYSALLGFHKTYSKLLLNGAVKNLEKATV